MPLCVFCVVCCAFVRCALCVVCVVGVQCVGVGVCVGVCWCWCWCVTLTPRPLFLPPTPHLSPCVRSNALPCIHSKRPRVYQQPRPQVLPQTHHNHNTSPPSLEILFFRPSERCSSSCRRRFPENRWVGGRGNRQETEPHAPAAGVAHEDEHHSGCWARVLTAAHLHREMANNDNIAVTYVSKAESSTPTW